MNADTFAAAWLERFAVSGGYVTVTNRKTWFGWSEEHHETARALFDLIKSIPGAVAVVKDHMASHGMTQYFNANKEFAHAC